MRAAFPFVLVSAVLLPTTLGEGTYELLTYNARLTRTGIVPHYTERKKTLLQELPKLTADVVCLQGVWLDADIVELADAAKSVFPYYHRLSPTPMSKPPCPISNLLAARQCADGRCDLSAGGIAGAASCLAKNCESQLRSLPQACVNCALNTAPADLINCGLSPKPSFPTTHGLLLLSKQRLTNKIERNYTRQLSGDVEVPPRGYIAADVDNIGTVVCTQLEDYGHPDIFYVGAKVYTSAKDEQSSSIQVLLNSTFIKNRGSETPVYLLGNFNHGPFINATLAPLYSDLYNVIVGAGFVSPAVSMLKKCSVCKSNELANFDSFVNVTIYSGFLIDHVYVPANLANKIVSVERKFVGNATGLAYPLSDHYAISVVTSNEFKFPTTPPAATTTPAGTISPTGASFRPSINVFVVVLVWAAAVAGKLA
ncbi:uncharacterized protein [Oscarella lobularis]|uniref:uncharacterized protein n=1 Tax=Oscarella lobularis TaxID=121494 RepID=UPI003313563C